MTPERMSWDEDEGLYQPKIHSQRIRALHQISRELGEPMTVLVDQALEQFIAAYDQACYRDWRAAFPAEAAPPASREQAAPIHGPNRRAGH